MKISVYRILSKKILSIDRLYFLPELGIDAKYLIIEKFNYDITRENSIYLFLIEKSIEKKHLLLDFCNMFKRPSYLKVDFVGEFSLSLDQKQNCYDYSYKKANIIVSKEMEKIYLVDSNKVRNLISSIFLSPFYEQL